MRPVPWIALGVLGVAFGLWITRLLAPLAGLVPACSFKRITGFACATCGATRCLLALGQCHWREALHWHPAMVALLAVMPFAALWDLRRAWRGEPYPALPESKAVRLAAWLVLAGVWVLQVARGI